MGLLRNRNQRGRGLTANVNVKVYPIKEAMVPTESSPCKEIIWIIKDGQNKVKNNLIIRCNTDTHIDIYLNSNEEGNVT